MQRVDRHPKSRGERLGEVNAVGLDLVKDARVAESVIPGGVSTIAHRASHTHRASITHMLHGTQKDTCMVRVGNSCMFAGVSRVHA